MSGSPIDFSSIGGTRVGAAAPGTPAPGAQPIDFSSIGGKKVDGGSPANPYPIDPGDKGGIAQAVKTGDSILKLPKNIWHAFTAEAQDPNEEAGATVLAKQYGLPQSVALGLHRLIIAPMVKEHEIANAYDTIHKSLPADQQEKEKDFSNMDSNLHKANMHRIASMVPMVGPLASDITEHYLQGDKSGAVSELLTNIAAGKALDSATKGVGKQINKVAPKTAVVAGEPTPIMAGQLKDAAPIAKTVAAEPSPAIAEAQQGAAQQGIKNVASDAANKVIEKTVSQEPKYAYRVRDVGEEGLPVRNGHAQATMSEQEAQGYLDGRQTMRGGVPQEVVKVDLNKLDPADYSIKEGPSGNDWVKFNKDLPESAMGETVPTKPEPVKAGSFSDAADQIKTAVQPTFKKLDNLSDGEFSAFQNKLKNATAAERRATSMQDMEAAQQAKADAQKGIDDLITKHSSQFQPDELANAQAAWKDMKVLDKVHGYVEKAFSAPEDVANASKTVSRDLSGSKLNAGLNQMLDKVPRADLTRVLGPDGVKNLYEIAELTKTPENLAKMQSQVNQLASDGAVSKLVKSPMEARNLVARYLATSPRVSGMMMNALKFGTPAKIYGPLIANEIAKGEQKDQQ